MHRKITVTISAENKRNVFTWLSERQAEAGICLIHQSDIEFFNYYWHTLHSVSLIFHWTKGAGLLWASALYEPWKRLLIGLCFLNLNMQISRLVNGCVGKFELPDKNACPQITCRITHSILCFVCLPQPLKSPLLLFRYNTTEQRDRGRR